MNKKEIRQQMLNKRKHILNKDALSKIIANKILNLDIYQKTNIIALYKSMKSEVDTNLLIKKSLNNKKVLVPRIINKKMKFIEINDNTDFIKSDFGVLEPVGDIYDGSITLMIIPGVAFDRKLNRLGYGMGYYDKYLKNKNIYKIGICFDEEIVDLLPMDEHDIKMDMIITEKRIYKKKDF